MSGSVDKNSGLKGFNNRNEEVSSVSRSLKLLAKELNVPIIALSQLGREAESSEPRLSDLRESGAIEQDADIVMFLYREGYYGSNEVSEEGDKNHGECIVAKNRHGETRTVDLHWQGEYMRFTAQEAYRSDF